MAVMISWKAEETAQWEKAIAPPVQRPEFRALELTSKHSYEREETEVGYFPQASWPGSLL